MATLAPQPDIRLAVDGWRRKVKNGEPWPVSQHGVYAFKATSRASSGASALWELTAEPPNRDGVTAGSTQIGSVSFAIAPIRCRVGLRRCGTTAEGGLATLNVFE